MDSFERNDRIKITRLAPKSGTVVFEVNKPYLSDVIVKEKGTIKSFNPHFERLGETSYIIKGLNDNTDYEIYCEYNEDKSGIRLFKCGDVPGTVINYIHPEDKTFLPSGMCPASPSIVYFNGKLIVSHDVFYRDMEQNLTLFFCSLDEGKTWSYLSCLKPCFWGKLFVHKNKLYIMGHSKEYGDLLIYQSDDEGKSWSVPCKIMDGGDNQTGGPHKGPMPVVEHNKRLWTAIDYGCWHLKGHASGVVSCPSDSDIMKGSNWTVSPFLKYDPDWEGTSKGESGGLLEGNVVVRPDGKLINLLRYQTNGCEPNYGKAIYLKIDKDNPDKPLSFGKVIDFHGNMSKFSVYFDKGTNKYWTITSRADNVNFWRRNELILMSSEDTVNWTVEKTLIDYENNSWHEPREKVGFQYVDFLFRNNMIYYVSRTALNGALNFHDSNQITFHQTTT